MSKENKKDIEIVESKDEVKKPSRKKRRRKKKIIIALKITLLVAFAAIIIVGGSLAGMVIGIVKSAPEIDPANLQNTLSESSVIVDEAGNFIEQIHDPNENREIIKLSSIPKNVQNAFIAIEDHRFESHFGIDIRRIMGSLLHNVKVGDPTAQGASTITQQLVKNIYLTNEKSWERKIKEIYLSIQVERKIRFSRIISILFHWAKAPTELKPQHMHTFQKKRVNSPWRKAHCLQGQQKVPCTTLHSTDITWMI